MTLEEKRQAVESWNANPPTRDSDWADDVCNESFDVKFDHQLEALRPQVYAKRDQCEFAADMARRYPQKIEAEIYERFWRKGFRGAQLDEEVASRTKRAIDRAMFKEAKLFQSATRLNKEIDLRRRKFVVRKPLGTTYYIDLNAGSDAAAGTSVGTAWKTFDKCYENVRTAGDIFIFKWGTTQTGTTDVIPISNGNTGLPIISTADWDNAFGNIATPSETGTFTLGSKTVTMSGPGHGIVANDMLWNGTDDTAMIHACHVESVSGEVITLSLPYLGTAGAGKTVKVGPGMPFWTNAGAFAFTFGTDYNQHISGIRANSADAGGTIQISSSNVTLDRCVSSNTAGAGEAVALSSTAAVRLDRCVLTSSGLTAAGVMDCTAGSNIEIKRSSITGNPADIIGTFGINLALGGIDVLDCFFKDLEAAVGVSGTTTISSPGTPSPGSLTFTGLEGSLSGPGSSSF